MSYRYQSCDAGYSYSDYYSYVSGGGGGDYRGYLWPEETKTCVLSAVPAVPKLAQYGMLAIGLASVTALARRRRA